MKRDNIYIMKGFAIISVIYAHCNNRISFTGLDALLEGLRASFGTVGVPIFFFLSGYLFHNDKELSAFLKSKVGTVLPWLFWGSIVWGYYVVRKGLGYANLFGWLLGIGNYLWYMRNIVLFWIVFFFIRSKKIKLSILIASVILRVCIFDIGCFEFVIKNQIANDFVCHLPFFASGFVAQDITFEKFFDRIHKGVLTLMAIAGLGLVIWLNEYKVAYESELFLIYIIAWFLVIKLAINVWLRKHTGKVLIWLGRNSFLIYLVHMPIAGMISNVFSANKYTACLVLIYPLIALAIVAVGVFVLHKLFEKNRVMCKICGIPVK